MKHVLVLGGAGFIGYNFIKWLNKNYPNVLISVFIKRVLVNFMVKILIHIES